MSGTLTASMKLQLEDLLSAPLQKVEDLLKRINDIGKMVSLDKLTESMQPLDAGARKAQEVADRLNGIGLAADEAVAPVTALTEALAETTAGADAAVEAADAVARVGMEASESAGRVGALLGRLRELGAAGAGAIGGYVGGVVRGTPGAVRDTGERLREVGNKASELGGAAMGAGMTGFGIYEPVHAAAEWDERLRQIAIAQSLTGAAADREMVRLNAKFSADALRTTQKSMGIAEAYQELLQLKMTAAQADTAIGVHSEAATAYGISAADLGPVTGALVKTMGITGEDDLRGALASIAQAGKMGRFKITDFATLYPGVAAAFALQGTKGRRGVNESAAMLETVMMNSSSPGQASADLVDLMHYMYSPREDKVMNKLLGKDLVKYLHKATQAGEDPLLAYLELLKKKLAGLSPNDQAQLSNELLRNQQAQSAALALVQHEGDYKSMLATLKAQTPATLLRDFATEMQGMQPTVQHTTEQVTQMSRSLGTGLYPVLQRINGLLHGLNAGYVAGDKASGGGVSLGVTAIGGTIAAGVGLNLLAKGAGFVGAGFKVLSPLARLLGLDTAFLAGRIGLLSLGFEGLAGSAAASALVIGGGILLAVGALGLGAYELYKHWDAVAAWFKRIWDDIAKAIDGAWASLRQFNGVAPLTGMGGGRGSVHGDDMHHQVEVHMHVSTDNPNTKVAVTSTRVTSAPNRGQVLGRP